MRQSRRTGDVLAIAFALFLFASTATAQNNKLQLYFFTNPQCGPCKMVEPELAKLYREGYSVMKIDTSIHPDWTERFQVTKTPTVILMSGHTVVASQSGFVDANTLKSWFDQAESRQPRQTTVPIANVATQRSSNNISNENESTVHTGTTTPANSIEGLAMQATVRLKIDDPEGTSYATGTVIHAVENEALVLTCGHVFRESQGTGTITAEYGFLESNTKNTVGELIYYDAKAKDVGLIAIKTDGSITPMPVAQASESTIANQNIFTIGCDNGRAPTIRRSKLIGTAKYDGVKKIEIVGRPAIGRSGGGLFTTDGKLIGVCNAAVVDADEGVYVTLDTIHWQFQHVNLAHLFTPNAADSLAVQPSAPTALASNVSNRKARNLNSIPVRTPLNPNARLAINSTTTPPSNTTPLRTNPVALTGVPGATATESDTELIIVMRRKDQGTTETWTVANPGSRLVSQLKEMSSLDSTRLQADRLAQLRATMPKLPQATGKNYNVSEMRAQSPR